MERRFRWLTLCLVAIHTPSVLTSQESARLSRVEVSRPTLRVQRATTPIRLDGRLDDAAWSLADSITDLRQVEPQENGIASSRTVVRVLATDDAIIFGIRADSPEAPMREIADGVTLSGASERASEIVSYARQRDASLDSEDHIKIVLDTYRDGRSGYVFALNPNGARYDALVSGQGDENAAWDAIWEARTARTATGWSAEVRIPIQSLLFRAGVTDWGFNVQRRIQSRQETNRWASPTRDYMVTQTSRAGVLSDLPRFELGAGLSVRPSVTSGGTRDSAGADVRTSAKASLDATQRLGANTLASLTVNTDFAETEVDTRRVNLTRFPLLFPEKRTFFLEGADIFDFGVGMDEDVLPFSSRRIGLISGQPIPIEAGAKINGRALGANYGALVVRTDDVDTLSSGNTMGVVRLKQNVLRESSVGMIGAMGDPLGRAGSWLVGPDLVYQTSRFRGDKNFLVGVWGLATGREGLDGDRTAAGAKIDYPNDLWDIVFKYKRIGDAFDPSLSFVPRTGVHVATFSADWKPRPSRPIGPLHVRQCFWENELNYVRGLTGGWQSYRYFTAPINCRLESGDRFEFNIVPTGERIAEPFEIADGVVIPAGTYHFDRFRLEAGTAQKRKLSTQATWWFGTFYDGRLDQFELTGAWRPAALVIVELSAERNVGRLSEGNFAQNLVGTRVRLNVSPDLQVSSFLQYDDNSNAFGTNTRLRWTFAPSGDLFVVYNHNMRTRDPLSMRRELVFASNQLLVKAQYALRY